MLCETRCIEWQINGTLFRSFTRKTASCAYQQMNKQFKIWTAALTSTTVIHSISVSQSFVLYSLACSILWSKTFRRQSLAEELHSYRSYDKECLPRSDRSAIHSTGNQDDLLGSHQGLMIAKVES